VIYWCLEMERLRASSVHDIMTVEMKNPDAPQRKIRNILIYISSWDNPAVYPGFSHAGCSEPSSNHHFANFYDYGHPNQAYDYYPYSSHSGILPNSNNYLDPIHHTLSDDQSDNDGNINQNTNSHAHANRHMDSNIEPHADFHSNTYSHHDRNSNSHRDGDSNFYRN